MKDRNKPVTRRNLVTAVAISAGAGISMVLSGCVSVAGEKCAEGAWVRRPDTSSTVTAVTATSFYLKTGHLG